MTEDRVRVLRVLEYEGTREWLEFTLSNNAVKGTKVFGNGVIREASIGEFPQVVEKTEKKFVPDQTLSPTDMKFMERLGWEIPMDGSPSVKYETPTGKVIAHEGSEVWTRDLKVVKEQS